MAPSSENYPAMVPDEASTGEMFSGPTLSGQPGKAVGHAGGNLTSRSFMVGHYANFFIASAGASAAILGLLVVAIAVVNADDANPTTREPPVRPRR